jgi:thiamine-monophosphate kinase
MHIKSEWELLNKIGALVKNRGISASDLVEPIGDDCAVFKTGDGRLGLITTDISIESIHFRRDFSDFNDIGFKAMMGNISDIAAMGGKSRFAFISLGIPDAFPEEDVLRIYDGMIDAANPAGVTIAGGDTSKSGELVINIALYGEAGDRLIRRSGASPGDIIYVTGSIGDSMAGLDILLSGKLEHEKQFPGLLEKHRRPVARFADVDELVKIFSPSSMIDISDGLLSDLRHIAEKSGTGFEIDAEKLPVSDALRSYCSIENKDFTGYALGSGEEYELLFTSAVKCMAELKTGLKVSPIGRVIDSGYFLIKNNIRTKAVITGFDHFDK